MFADRNAMEWALARAVKAAARKVIAEACSQANSQVRSERLVCPAAIASATITFNNRREPRSCAPIHVPILEADNVGSPVQDGLRRRSRSPPCRIRADASADTVDTRCPVGPVREGAVAVPGRPLIPV
jgi:hypothetical protein